MRAPILAPMIVPGINGSAKISGSESLKNPDAIPVVKAKKDANVAENIAEVNEFAIEFLTGILSISCCSGTEMMPPLIPKRPQEKPFSMPIKDSLPAKAGLYFHSVFVLARPVLYIWNAITTEIKRAYIPRSFSIHTLLMTLPSKMPAITPTIAELARIFTTSHIMKLKLRYFKKAVMAMHEYVISAMTLARITSYPKNKNMPETLRSPPPIPSIPPTIPERNPNMKSQKISVKLMLSKGEC